MRVEAYAIWKSIPDRRVPWHIRAIAPACALAYAIFPIDPIPNRLPVIGHLDDVLIAALVVALFVRLMPSSIMQQHRSDAAEKRGRWLALKRQT